MFLLCKEVDLEKGLVMDSITTIVYTNCWLFVVEETFCNENSSSIQKGVTVKHNVPTETFFIRKVYSEIYDWTMNISKVVYNSMNTFNDLSTEFNKILLRIQILW